MVRPKAVIVAPHLTETHEATHPDDVLDDVLVSGQDIEKPSKNEHAHPQDDQEPKESGLFCALVGFSVFANVQVVALETDYGCVTPECTLADRLPWYVFDHLFTVLFIADIAATMHMYGICRYLRGDPLIDTHGFQVFNCLDCLIVLLRVVDVWMVQPAGIDTGLRFISLLRIVHITRCVKLLRLVPSFRELWLVFSGMKDTLKVVLWVVVLLVILLWVFATFITIAVGKSDSAQFDFGRSMWSKDDYWGDVPRSMYSLFQVLTGDEWSSSLSWPLIQKYPVLVSFFVAFRCVAVLALLNTIVGVVVEQTLSSARSNEEKKAKWKQRRDTVTMASLKEIFHFSHTDKRGLLNKDELQAACKRPEVRDRFQMLEIPIKDIYLLHELLDEDSSGKVETGMFFRGCARLHGSAMAIDLHQMSVDIDRHITLADVLLEKSQSANDELAELLNAVDGVDVDIVKGDADKKDPVLVARRGRARQPKANILRSSNWIDNCPPEFLLESRSETKGTRAGTKVSTKPSLVRATLRAASSPDEQPGQYAQPDVPPPPPPLPSNMSASSPGSQPPRPSQAPRPSRVSVKGFQTKRGFQWPT